MFTLNDFTDEQWEQITDLAIQMLVTKQFGDDTVKTSIYAFIEWMSHQDFDIASDPIHTAKTTH